MPKDFHNATLVEREHVHEDLAFFRVRYNDHPVPDFEPGQFATLGLPDTSPPDPNKPTRPGRGPKLIRRAYSIASPATQKDLLEFYIVRVDEGKLTPSLWDVEVGQTLFMNEKIGGHFTLPPAEETVDQTLVMVGTGTGLAPFRSMYLTHRDTPPAERRWNKLVLFDGCRMARDLGYFDELTRLSEEDENFLYFPTVTREPEDTSWAGLRGRVNTYLEPQTFLTLTGLPLDPATCHVFLCGNPQMIDQVEANLGTLGFVARDRKNPEGNLHFERYW
jgi:ferredoxin--NADP+ reductase